MRPALALLLAAALCAPACGYRMLRPEVGGGRTVAVPTPVNQTGWNGIEAELAGGLRADMQRQLDVTLGSGSPDLVLESEIVEARRQARVSNTSGGAALGVGSLTVVWRLKDRSGELLGSGEVKRDLEFLPSLDEDAYNAFTGILAEVSEQIVLEVGAALDAEQKAAEEVATDTEHDS